MRYTTLGKRTGRKVSVLGFGAMRLPMKDSKIDRDKAIPMIHRAFEKGVNYIDTAVGYCNGDSQCVVGEALKGWRDRVTVSTKNHVFGRKAHDQWRRNLDDSLRLLDVDVIDIYNLHGLNWKAFRENVDGPGGSYEWMAKARDEGLIRHICFSFHDTPEALEKIARTGLFDVVTCQYNLLDRGNAKAFRAVKEQGMGIVVMGPVGGGRLGAPSEALQKLIPGARSVPEVALRFVMANPHVDVALSGMSTMAQVEENCRVASSRRASLTAAERRHVDVVLDRYRKLADLYCTGCRYCMPCPAGVDIPANFDNLNKFRVYGLKDLARRSYAHGGNQARLCLACGRCMSKCPQKLDIVKQLRETVRTLDDAYGKIEVRLKPRRLRVGPGCGGAAEIVLSGSLECVNYGDREVRPRILFAPARGVKVEAGSIPALSSFERRAVPVCIRARIRPGGRICTGLEVRGGVKAIGPAPTLRPAVLKSGGKRSLAGAAVIALDEDDPSKRVTAGARRAHGAGFAAAYDAKRLYVRLKVRDDLRAGAGEGRPLHEADRIEVGFDLAGLARPEGNSAPRLRRMVQAGLPTGREGECPVSLTGVWGAPKGIRAGAKKTAGGMTVDLEIEWVALGCPPGRAGRSFGMRVSHVSHPRRGKADYIRHWGRQGGWAMLA